MATTLFGVPVEPAQRHRRDAGADHRPGRHRRRRRCASASANPAPPEDFGGVHRGPAGDLDRGGLRVRARLASRDQPAAPPTPADASRGGAPARRADGHRPGATCAEAIKETLQAGSRIDNPATGRPVFAFRLHQFLSKGDNVYVTLESPGRRHVTSTYQVAAPGGRPGRARPHPRSPTAFCRECGQEYLAVDPDRYRRRRGRYRPRQDNDAGGGNDSERLPVHQRRPALAGNAGAGTDRRPAAVLLGDLRPGDRRSDRRPGAGRRTCPSRSTWT